MKKFIEKWLKQGLISPRQAKQMSADIDKDSSEKSSKKIIFTFSLIGAALAGAVFFLFISANWQLIPSFCKVLLVAAVTFGCAFGGYLLEFENKKYPKTGASLLFLSAIMFGALIMLTAQIYHVDSNRSTHILVLIWFLGIIPYAYILQSRSAAALSCALFMIWIWAFISKYNDFYDYWAMLPLLYSAAALFIYVFGKANTFFESATKMSGVFIKFAIFILYFCIFFMTFNYFAAPDKYALMDFLSAGEYPAGLRLTHLLLVMSAVLLLPSFFFNPSKSKAHITESSLTAVILCLCVTLYGRNFIPYELLRIATNLLFASMLLALIYIGYRKKETFYVNLGIFWTIVFMAVKYFDFFWRLFPKALFFLSGGILLVAAALFLEHKRRGINTEFKTAREINGDT